jgi:hypothetical protein
MRRKKHFWMPVLLGVSMISVFLLMIFSNQGCTAKMPVSTTFVATATPTVQPIVIDNLEDGDTYLNPAMCGTTSTGVPLGFWVASTWGPSSNVINGMSGANIVFCDGMGANNTSCAIHIYGNITDVTPTTYPSFQLEGKLRGGSYLDISQYGYTGVRYYMKIGTGDNCLYRRFNVGIGATTPQAGGGYANSTNAYSHFGATLTTTGGVWTQKTFIFTSLIRAFGTPLSPSTLSGNHLKELLEVEWQFGRNGSSGSSTVDYWIDEVEFF